jgi:hypothetical protein
MSAALALAPGSNYPVARDRKTVAIVDEFWRNKAEADRLESCNKELRPVIEDAMGDSPVLCAGARIVRRTDVAGTPPRPNVKITRAMIGQVIPGSKGRAGYTRIEVL